MTTSPAAPESAYIGTELDIFARAVHWKRYFSRRIRPFLGREVLEVGGGIGATTEVLCDGSQSRWVVLEPDGSLAARARARSLPACCAVREGTLRTVDAHERFDSILYVDVLEHIQDDGAELARAADHLAPGGHVIVLAPALPSLFSPFDAAVGHHRRYTKASLTAITPSGTRLVRCDYLDACGMVASFANRWLLRRADPRLEQILFWDRYLVRASMLLDPLHRGTLGKSLLSVWQRRDAGR